MKIRGEKRSRPTRTFTLDCGEEITVQAPRLGAIRRAIRAVPDPAPPQKVVRSRDHGAQYLVDEHAPEYQRKLIDAKVLQGIYLFWEAVKDGPPGGPPDIEFEATLAEGEDPDREFVERLAAEIDAGPLTGADIKRVTGFVKETTALSEQEAADTEGFSGAAGD